MKILSPAGNFECLKVAVHNGADEVYLGVNEFNARNNIDGFDMATIKDAIDYAHLFGVKVLLAVNILFTDKEMQSALDIVVQAYNLGVDAFIVQDLGLMSLINKYYPEIELHASTQMGLHNLEGVLEVLKYGVKRVVLARETPLLEIKRIKENTNVEIEYFVHGALCVSFSGNCYLSSYLFNASGNRGRCKQLCRLPYTLYEGDKKLKKGYLLSAKDFDMSKKLKDLKDAGVDVLKIEGRARRPFYVGTITREYRHALDGNLVDQENIKLAFNRNFTQGYFNGNGKIISAIQNHLGINVGVVERVNSGKNFNEVFFTSNRTLTAKSTFKFFDGQLEKNALTAFDLKEISKGKYRLTTTQKVDVGNAVNLITDAYLESEILKPLIKRELCVEVEVRIDKPLVATVNLNGKVVKIEGDVCQPALKHPLTKEDIEKNFSKSEYFNVHLKINKLEKVFVAKQKLNEFRRCVLTTAYNVIVDSFRHDLKKTILKIPQANKVFDDFEFFDSLNAIPKTKNVIYSPENYSLSDVLSVKEKCLELGKTLYLDTPYFALEKDIELLKNIIDNSGVSIVANNYYALSLSENVVIGAGLNAYNSYTAKVYDKMVFSGEGEQFNRVNAPYMTLRHCPIKSHVGGDCNKCRYNKNYSYKMDNGKVMKLKRKKLSDCTFYLTD